MASKTDPRFVVLALAIGAVALTGCAGKSTSGNRGASAPASPSATAEVTAAAAPSASAASSASPTVDQRIHITYANGKVSGVGARVKVKHNSTVALIVTSDVADEVHFHGYNRMADVTKGGTVTIVFKATLQGVFEVELEKLKHRLVLLQIQ